MTTSDTHPCVTIPGYGVVQGKTAEENPQVAQFYNIPFGTVTKRWRPAVKPESWTGIRDATRPGPGPPQQTVSQLVAVTMLGVDADYGYDKFQSERDCLNCNILLPLSALSRKPNLETSGNTNYGTRAIAEDVGLRRHGSIHSDHFKLPTEDSTQGLPVMVWIYGGSLGVGSNNVPIYDATELISKGIECGKEVIFVGINYRVNYFGFLSSKEMRLDAQKHDQEYGAKGSRPWHAGSYGNWGFLDQIMALEWIRDNISAFGGDPRKVTLFGQSAGSCSISNLMMTQACHGLFHRTILMSGAATTLVAMDLEQEGQRYFDELCAKYNIPHNLDPLEKVERLRDIPAKDIAEMNSTSDIVFFRPTIDGVVVKRDVRESATDPNMYDPNLNWVLIGANKDEGSMFADLIGAPKLELFPAFKKRLCAPGDESVFDEIFGIPKTDQEANDTSSRVITNGVFAFPKFQVSQAILAHPTCQLSRYHYDCVLASLDKLVPGFGSNHFIGIFYSFGNKDGKAAPMMKLSPAEADLAANIQRDILLEFVTAKSPEGDTNIPKVNRILPLECTEARDGNFIGEGEEMEALVFSESLEIKRGVVERLSKKEIEFWQRSYAYASEQRRAGRATEVGFDIFRLVGGPQTGVAPPPTVVVG